ncbi:hypothetical protein Tco_0087485 [Tanacetum coccineum]
MDKEVTVKVKDHKRKHDSDDEEDDDDMSPSADRTQMITKVSKKPRESDASASKQHPALTSTGWQITDTRDDVVNSLMHMLPNNIQITDTSLMHMLNLNPSPHKEDSQVSNSYSSEQEAAEHNESSQRKAKYGQRQPGTEAQLRNYVVSDHFDRDDNAGDDNEETNPDPEEIYK